MSVTRPSPMTASTKLSATCGRWPGRSKPSVSSDEPDTMNASPIGSIPVAQKMAVKPNSTKATHTPGSRSNASGA